jgi:hypothetical protein
MDIIIIVLAAPTIRLVAIIRVTLVTIVAITITTIIILIRTEEEDKTILSTA